MTAVQQWQQICPLCGADNRCAVAAGQPPEECWCQTASIDAAALATIGADSVGKRCLCPACGQTKGETNDGR